MGVDDTISVVKVSSLMYRNYDEVLEIKRVKINYDTDKVNY